MAFADRTLAELLDRIAAQEPAPGGGIAAAWAGAIAAALVEMAAAVVLARSGPADERIAALRSRATGLRARQLELAEEDMRSYQPVLDALGLERGDPARAARLQAALSAAAEVPLAIAAAAAEVAELAADVAQAGSRQLVGDATAAAVLAEASTRAAVRLVELNLAHDPEDGRLRLATGLAERAWAARMSTLGLG